ncbi:MAG: hypothetical protein Q8O61_02165, partial [Nocardioides sp.]|nr:hypothetical protein [Nocardioides sp.]
GDEAVAVDGGLVAGTASTSAGTRAVLWTRKSAVKGPTPVVVGKAKVGSTLTARRGTWTPSGVRMSQRWLRDGRVIRGATKVRYRLVKADRGHRISVAVTGSKAGWVSLTRTSRQTARIR